MEPARNRLQNVRLINTKTYTINRLEAKKLLKSLGQDKKITHVALPPFLKQFFPLQDFLTKNALVPFIELQKVFSCLAVANSHPSLQL